MRVRLALGYLADLLVGWAEAGLKLLLTDGVRPSSVTLLPATGSWGAAAEKPHASPTGSPCS